MLNNITIQGRLVRDPELKKTTSGISTTTFAIACKRNYKVNQEKVTDFLDIVAWRQLADRICQYWTKGKEIVIVGSVETRSYTTKDGQKRKVWEIKANEAYFTNKERQETQAMNQDPGDYSFTQIPDDEDLPF